MGIYNNMKTLRRKDTKEFAVYMDESIGLCELPTILANTATIEGLKNYHEEFVLPKHTINPQDEIIWGDYEMIEYPHPIQFGEWLLRYGIIMADAGGIRWRYDKKYYSTDELYEVYIKEIS